MGAIGFNYLEINYYFIIDYCSLKISYVIKYFVIKINLIIAIKTSFH